MPLKLFNHKTASFSARVPEEEKEKNTTSNERRAGRGFTGHALVLDGLVPGGCRGQQRGVLGRRHQLGVVGSLCVGFFLTSKTPRESQFSLI